MSVAMIARGPMPLLVRFALVLLWTAWLISASAWIVHLYEVRDPGGDLYAAVGFPGIVAQGLLIYLIGRGNNLARLVVLFVAIPALVVVQTFFFSQFHFSSLRLWVETVLRGVALVFLLVPQSALWFKRTRVPGR